MFRIPILLITCLFGILSLTAQKSNLKHRVNRVKGNATAPAVKSSRIYSGISGVINTYTPVLAYSSCENKFTVQNGAGFNAGDTVLLIQMKGAVVDSSNAAVFGNIIDYKSAGNYEINYVKSRTGNVIEFRNALTRTYEIPQGLVQLVRVPYYQNAEIIGLLTCTPWNGSSGGIIAFNVKDTLTLNYDIDAGGKGFRGGNDPFTNPLPLYCYESDYFYPPNPDLASEKGESIAQISAARSYGRGAPANGGGGGNSHNSGGGGGSSAATGGLGGYQYEFTPCNATVPFDNRGIGGKPLLYSNTNNRVFLGGGGGAGQSNNPQAFEGKGGGGGGLIIITAGVVKSNGRKISSNGDAAANCGSSSSGCHEGMGGGGGGGAVLLKAGIFQDNLLVEAAGGRGGDMTAAGFYRVAPGGGGSGGVVWLGNTTLPPAVTVSVPGGLSGVCTAYNNDPWGATNGQQGLTITGLSLPLDTLPFRKNIDSLKIADSLTACRTFAFTGTAFTNQAPVVQWQWNFGDGNSAGGQNVSHTYTAAGTYTVKLVVSDVNGCRDSISRALTVINCEAVVCRSSVGLKRASNSIVDVQPAGAGSFSQLYNTGGFTWETWYRPDGNILNQSLLISTEDAVLFQDIFLGFGWGATPNALSFLVSDNGTTNTTVFAEALQTLSPGTWYHIAGVCDYTNAELRLYLDGNLVASRAIPPAILNNRLSANRLTQIGNASGRLNGIDGAVDDIRFWSAVRTQAEIQNNMTACLSMPQPGLVAFFRADENYGTSAKSDVDLNFSGNLRNVTWAAQAPNVNCQKVFFTDSAADCSRYFFRGQLPAGYTPAQIVQWQWTFGDGSGAYVQNPIHSYAAAGVYPVKLIITDGNGCRDSLTRNITVNTVNADAGPDTAFCTNGTVSVSLQAAGGTAYSWSPAVFLNNNNIANPLATVSSTTRFYVTVSNAAGCSDVDSVTVVVNPLPSVSAGSDTAVCENTVLILLASGASSYVWSPGIYVSDSVNTNPVYTGTGSQLIWVTGTSPQGCKASDTVLITLKPLPQVKTIEDTLLCSVQPLILTTTGAASYRWTPAANLSNPFSPNPVFTGSVSQTYIVTGNGVNGCSANDTVAIAIRTLNNIQPPPAKSVCRGGTLTLGANNGPGFQYAWTPSAGLSNAFIENPFCFADSTTLYALQITDTVCSLQVSYPVLVTVNQLPRVTAGKSSDINCAVPFSNLSAGGALQYSWTPVTGLSNPGISNPVAAPGVSTIYTVKGTDANGCLGYAAVEVKVLAGGKESAGLPNAFTPNGDGLNDCFGPGRIWPASSFTEFRIFNRWGEQVYASNVPSACWNGIYKGVPAEAGNYVYYLRTQTFCGLVERKGNVVLLR